MLPAVAKIVHFVWTKSAQSFLLQLEFAGRGLELAGPARLPLQTNYSLPATQWHQYGKLKLIHVCRTKI